jgi:hypothetical protein
MATNDPLSPESQRIVDEVLRHHGIKPKTATQTALDDVWAAAGVTGCRRTCRN